MASLAAIVTYILIGHVEIVVSGDPQGDALKQVLFCNHQTFLDWWFLGLTLWHSGQIGGLVIILMDMLKYIPILGFFCQCCGFIFLKQVLSKDKPILAKSLHSLANRPTEPLTLLIFPEGLLVHPQNLATAKAFLEKQTEEATPGVYIPRVPEHVILPRSKGLRTCLQLLNASGSSGPVGTLVDVTMGYWPSSRGFETGVYPHDSVTPFTVFGSGTPLDISRVCLDFRIMKEENSVAALNRMTDVEFDGWLKRRWEVKDELMGRFHESGMFVEVETDEVVFRVVPRWVDFGRVLGAFVVLWGIVAGIVLLVVYTNK
ncbi:hypothetical protein HDU98_011775 [Podochytrium sp. JEL0797]|nr:hypothetical protein HDU98_011775 [Podochytrium sp. JEL0797]